MRFFYHCDGQKSRNGFGIAFQYLQFHNIQQNHLITTILSISFFLISKKHSNSKFTFFLPQYLSNTLPDLGGGIHQFIIVLSILALRRGTSIHSIPAILQERRNYCNVTNLGHQNLMPSLFGLTQSLPPKSLLFLKSCQMDVKFDFSRKICKIHIERMNTKNPLFPKNLNRCENMAFLSGL